jgi:2-polyprenyl-6-methoxyphenol hydroxylase-like FAD-dependent oxidoreductase
MTTDFSSNTTTTTDVLVVGAGPAGLATAISAARHGARVLVVERHASTSVHPRATGLSTRTMEILRSWGIADPVRDRSVECDLEVAITRSASEQPLAVQPTGYPTPRGALAASPSMPALCAQDHLEPLLVDALLALGGEIRFGTALTGLCSTPDGVRAELGRAGRVRARFVVGADGSRSRVRRALGIGVQRLGVLGEFVQAVFRPDLAELTGQPTRPLTLITHPDAEGVLLPVGGGRWAFAHEWHPERGETPDYSAARWTALLRTATGLPELAPEILSVLPFTMAADVATTYRAGNGFLVGDAAHRMTPVGAVGLNTAVHDGHELGWRLAWSVRGLAGDALLDSYAAEREPVGRANAERSLRRGEPDRADGLSGDLGRTYLSAVLAGAEPASPRCDRAARPGERAPHAWIRHEGRRCSVLDLFEGRLTVLAGTDGDLWRAAANRLRGIPLQVLTTDAEPRLRRAYRLAPGSAVLVRPDGIVAWRHDGPYLDPASALSNAVATSLGRASTPAAVAV